MVLVVSHPGAVLDEIPYPARGPQSAGISERLGPTLERGSRSRNWAGLSFAGRPVVRPCAIPAARLLQALAPTG